MLRKIWNSIGNNLKRGFEIDEDITKEELENYLKKDVTIVDVRSPQEFREGHVEGAICIPDYEIKSKAKGIIPNKEKIIIVYCSTGHRSKKVQNMLKKMGYKNVFNVYEGIEIN